MALVGARSRGTSRIGLRCLPSAGSLLIGPFLPGGHAPPGRNGRDVAQPGSASHWGCGGRRFESSRPDQFSGINVRPGDGHPKNSRAQAKGHALSKSIPVLACTRSGGLFPEDSRAQAKGNFCVPELPFQVQAMAAHSREANSQPDGGSKPAAPSRFRTLPDRAITSPAGFAGSGAPNPAPRTAPNCLHSCRYGRR
jgi:hypothetical protein